MGRRRGTDRQRFKPEESPRTTALRYLHRGGEHFNLWRRSTELKFLDFSGVTVVDVDLSGVNLAGIKLKGAKFERVNLSRALLSGANLNFARLTDVSLESANLRQARLESAILTRVRLEEVNLFGTSRDNWQLLEVNCERCWITSDRKDNPEGPDLFAPGEFAVAYGGQRIRVKFPGGITPVDLLSLPFHAQQILENFQDKQLILTGLSTVGEPALEFRVEDPAPQELQAEVQRHFDRIAPLVRERSEGAFRELIGLYAERLRSADDLSSKLLELLARSVNTPGPTSPTLFLGPVNMDSYNANAMRDQYKVGQAGAVGPQSHGSDNKFLQVWNEGANTVDLNQVADELTRLRAALKDWAATAEQDAAVGEIAAAEVAARQKDGPKMLAHLKKSGGWTLGIAEKIGVAVAAGAIRTSLGV